MLGKCLSTFARMLKYPRASGYCFLVALVFANANIEVRVVNNAAFRLQSFPKTLDNLTNCTLTDSRNQVTIIHPFDYEDISSQISDPRIERLGDGQCGVRVHNASSRTDAGRWTLTLSNDEESKALTFRVSFVSWEEPINRTTTAEIGTSRMNLLCGPSNNMLYCELRDPQGNRVELNQRTRCQTQIQRLSVRHFGVWTCTVGLIGAPSEIHATHTLQMRENAQAVVIYANETSLGTFISWRVYGRSGTSLWCRAFAPNGETILVLPGMENEKYVSVSTNLTQHRCGLLITGKFPEEHHGTWRLEIGVNTRRAMGGFIKMPEGKIPDPNDYKSSSKPVEELNVPSRESFRINCQAEYSAAYCWIGGPHGQEFTQSENLTVGRCSQMINGSTAAEHSGMWTCNMAYENGGPEEQFITKVNVVEKTYQAMNSETKVHLGDKAVIACRSVLEIPLEYCRFVRPDGKGFGVAPGMNASSQYSYEGPGMDYGYCGLAISSVEIVDVGEWRCASRSRGHMWEGEVWDTSNLRITETTFGISTSGVIVIGLISGVFLSLLVITVVTALRRKSRYGRRESQETVISSATS